MGAPIMFQIKVEVDSPEELMVLDLVRAVLAEPMGLTAEARTTRDVEAQVPSDHLKLGLGGAVGVVVVWH